MQGRYSIKVVLPAFCPDLSDIQDGGPASALFAALYTQPDREVILTDGHFFVDFVTSRISC
jgi:hypothetical protein